VKILYFDCFSGASGDMVLGALIDAGVPLAEIRRALGSLTVDADAVWTEPVVRAGIRATKFCVRGEDGHSHAGEADGSGGTHEPHRTLLEVARLIDGSALSACGKARATALFQRMGEVEAAIHGVSLEHVHLHEVGALDSIVDIVGAVHAMECLGAERVVASPLNVGSGSVHTAHGTLPVPAPATLRLLAGAPVYAGRQKTEMVTPTGALLVSGYATSFGPLPAMTVRSVGYGAGARDFPDAPNVLRVVLGDDETTAAATPTRVAVIEAEIDDMTPQLFGAVMDTLLASGALDVFYTPVQMKKNRPGTLLTVIAQPGARASLTSLIFRETTTIGVRYRESEREILDRDIVVVSTAAGSIRVKVARQRGEILNVSPEFDDCVQAAKASGRPVKDVQALAVRAFHDRPEGASA
jgi:pyridinium-3,5-bisthiocarboxylic acid mononucleotide nickel chelatase